MATYVTANEKAKNEFIIPVAWMVSDIVKVQANSLEEAYDYVKEHMDEIPCGDEPEYIEGSYEISADDWEGCKPYQKHNTEPCNDCICKNCKGGQCQISPEDDAPCKGNVSEMEECGYVAGYEIENMTLDAKVTQIRKDAAEIEKILERCKNLGDIRNLRHVSGILSNAIMIFNGEYWCTAYATSLLDSYKTQKVRLKGYGDFLNLPIYDYEDKILYFDIFDSTYDDYCAILEDCTLANFEKAYREYVEKQEELQ